MREIVPGLLLLASATLAPHHACARGGLLHARPAVCRAAPIRASSGFGTPNLEGIATEARRREARARKKLAKAEEKVAACEARAGDCDLLRLEASVQAEALAQMSDLCSALADAMAGGSRPTAVEIAALAERAEALGVGDAPPPRQPRGSRKVKGPRPSRAPRLPYRTFRASEGSEIRVGRSASDNDALSLEPAHRHPDDWWMHAAGCPGSHVIIRADGRDELPEEDALDAAVLAANYSRALATGASVVRVNLCRARQVVKPVGAKPGLVQLRGDVATVRVDWRSERRRLERLASSTVDG